MNKSGLRFAVLFIAIVVVGVVVNAWAYLVEAHVDRKQFKDFPEQMGDWRRFRADTIIDDATMAVVLASDYLLRDYVPADGQPANFDPVLDVGHHEGARYPRPIRGLP